MTPLLAASVGVAHYLIVGAVLFTAGVVCLATKRNLLGTLMGVELVLNGANVNFIAIGSPVLGGAEPLGVEGQLIALVVIVLAAAEAAVALAIALNFYNTVGSVDVDEATRLGG